MTHSFTDQAAGNIRLSRPLVLITSIFLVGFLGISGYQYILQRTKASKINQLNSVLIDKYDVDASYDAGTAIECVKQGPTRFGDVTGIHVCNLIAAKVYYPRVKIETQKEVHLENGQMVEKPLQYVSYVNDKGESLNQYIQFGTPIRQLSGENPYYVDDKLGLKGYDHVVFSGLHGFTSESGISIEGKTWGWSSETSWLGHDSPGSRLQASIAQKILANRPPTNEAPTASEAARNGKAPLVVFYILRYCHSPSILVLDKLCILPS